MCSGGKRLERSAARSSLVVGIVSVVGKFGIGLRELLEEAFLSHIFGLLIDRRKCWLYFDKSEIELRELVEEAGLVEEEADLVEEAELVEEEAKLMEEIGFEAKCWLDFSKFEIELRELVEEAKLVEEVNLVEEVEFEAVVKIDPPGVTESQELSRELDVVILRLLIRKGSLIAKAKASESAKMSEIYISREKWVNRRSLKTGDRTYGPRPVSRQILRLGLTPSWLDKQASDRPLQRPSPITNNCAEDKVSTSRIKRPSDHVCGI